MAAAPGAGQLVFGDQAEAGKDAGKVAEFHRLACGFDVVPRHSRKTVHGRGLGSVL